MPRDLAGKHGGRTNQLFLETMPSLLPPQRCFLGFRATSPRICRQPLFLLCLTVTLTTLDRWTNKFSIISAQRPDGSWWNDALLDNVQFPISTSPPSFLTEFYYWKKSFSTQFFWSSFGVHSVKDPELSLQQLGSLLWLGFSPWLRNFHMLWVWPKKKRNNFSHVCFIS